MNFLCYHFTTSCGNRIGTLAFLSLEVFPGPEVGVGCGDNQRDGNSRVMVVIGLSGGIKGSLCLVCPAGVALTLSCLMAKKSYSTFGPKASDSLGELFTLVVSSIQAKLANHGAIHLTPTTVVSGIAPDLSSHNRLSRFKQSFQVENSLFCVDYYS
jgi:chemotaxis protein CheX